MGVEGVPVFALGGEPSVLVAGRGLSVLVAGVDGGVGVLPADAPGWVPPGVQGGQGGLVGPGLV